MFNQLIEDLIHFFFDDDFFSKISDPDFISKIEKLLSMLHQHLDKSRSRRATYIEDISSWIVKIKDNIRAYVEINRLAKDTENLR